MSYLMHVLILGCATLAVEDFNEVTSWDAPTSLAAQQARCTSQPFDLTEWRKLCDAALLKESAYETALLACLGVLEMEGGGDAPLATITVPPPPGAALSQRERFAAYVLAAVRRAHAVETSTERDAAFDALATLHGHLAMEGWIDGDSGAVPLDHAVYAFHLGSEDGHSIWPATCAVRGGRSRGADGSVATRLLPRLPAEIMQSFTSRWIAQALREAEREEEVLFNAIERGSAMEHTVRSGGLPALETSRSGATVITSPRRGGGAATAALRALRERECSAPFVRATLSAWVLRSARGTRRRAAALRAEGRAAEVEAAEDDLPWNRYEVPLQHLPAHVVDAVVAAALAESSGALAPPPMQRSALNAASAVSVDTPHAGSLSATRVHHRGVNRRRSYTVNNFAYGTLYAHSLVRALVAGLDATPSGRTLPSMRPSRADRCLMEREGGSSAHPAPSAAARTALHEHVARMAAAPAAANSTGVLVLGANIGVESIILHWVLGGATRVVGVEILGHLVAIANEVTTRYGVGNASAAAPLEFLHRDALDVDVGSALPRGNTTIALVYMDDDSWDDTLVAATLAKLARELPSAAHGARTLLLSWHEQVEEEASSRWALRGGFPIEASWALSCRPNLFVRELVA